MKDSKTQHAFGKLAREFSGCARMSNRSYSPGKKDCGLRPGFLWREGTITLSLVFLI